MSQINLVEPNVLCSLYHLELPPEIVQKLYTEYIIDNKQKIEILYKLYYKYNLCNINIGNLYHTFSILWRLEPYKYRSYNVRYYRNRLLMQSIQEEEKHYKKKNKNNKNTKKDTYYQNKARLKLKNY